jgi:DNA-binding NarL/FixJ family response regulator
MRVVLIDEDELFRRELRKTLESQPDMEIVLDAADGNNVDLDAAAHADVIVMGLVMHGINGLEAVARLARPARGRVLAVSSSDDRRYTLAMRSVGVLGHVAKGTAFGALVPSAAWGPARATTPRAARVARFLAR